MREFDIYVPLSTPEGKRVSQSRIEALKKRLLGRFGGVTYFPQRNEGLWKIGHYTFRDKIVIFRVIASAGYSTTTFFLRLKETMERDWHQEEVLIISREITIL